MLPVNTEVDLEVDRSLISEPGLSLWPAYLLYCVPSIELKGSSAILTAG